MLTRRGNRLLSRALPFGPRGEQAQQQTEKMAHQSAGWSPHSPVSELAQELDELDRLLPQHMEQQLTRQRLSQAAPMMLHMQSLMLELPQAQNPLRVPAMELAGMSVAEPLASGLASG